MQYDIPQAEEVRDLRPDGYEDVDVDLPGCNAVLIYIPTFRTNVLPPPSALTLQPVPHGATIHSINTGYRLLAQQCVHG